MTGPGSSSGLNGAAAPAYRIACHVVEIKTGP